MRKMPRTLDLSVRLGDLRELVKSWSPFFLVKFVQIERESERKRQRRHEVKVVVYRSLPERAPEWSGWWLGKCERESERGCGGR